MHLNHDFCTLKYLYAKNINIVYYFSFKLQRKERELVHSQSLRFPMEKRRKFQQLQTVKKCTFTVVLLTNVLSLLISRWVISNLISSALFILYYSYITLTLNLHNCVSGNQIRIRSQACHQCSQNGAIHVQNERSKMEETLGRRANGKYVC